MLCYILHYLYPLLFKFLDSEKISIFTPLQWASFSAFFFFLSLQINIVMVQTLYCKFKPDAQRLILKIAFHVLMKTSPWTLEDSRVKTVDREEWIRFVLELKPVREKTFTNSIVNKFLCIDGFLYTEQYWQDLQWHTWEEWEKDSYCYSITL